MGLLRHISQYEATTGAQWQITVSFLSYGVQFIDFIPLFPFQFPDLSFFSLSSVNQDASSVYRSCLMLVVSTYILYISLLDIQRGNVQIGYMLRHLYMYEVREFSNSPSFGLSDDIGEYAKYSIVCLWDIVRSRKTYRRCCHIYSYICTTAKDAADTFSSNDIQNSEVGRIEDGRVSHTILIESIQTLLISTWLFISYSNHTDFSTKDSGILWYRLASVVDLSCRLYNHISALCYRATNRHEARTLEIRVFPLVWIRLLVMLRMRMPKNL